MVSDELDQLARLLAPSTICLQDEGEELRMVSNGTGLVLPALAAFHRGSCAQRALRGTGPVCVTRRVNDRDIHVPDNRAERELDVRVLIISVPELKARLQPRLAASLLDLMCNNTSDSVVPRDTLTRPCRMGERVEGVMRQRHTAVTMRWHDVGRRHLRPHA